VQQPEVLSLIMLLHVLFRSWRMDDALIFFSLCNRVRTIDNLTRVLILFEIGEIRSIVKNLNLCNVPTVVCMSQSFLIMARLLG